MSPASLPPSRRKHPWIFAVYKETASDREDGRDDWAFLFRNADRTRFGIRESLGQGYAPKDLMAKWACKVVVDPRFRDALLSEDPDLPRMWKDR